MWLLLDINRKSYMGNPTAPFDLTLSELERQSQCQPDFEAFISQRTLVMPYVIINLYGACNGTFTFDFE